MPQSRAASRIEGTDGQDAAGRPVADPAGQRITLDPDTVQHDLAKLVLSLVETVRQLLERQALRRVEGGRLSPQQIEQMGLTLMRLEERMAELKAQFGLADEELRLDLGNLLGEL
ncbi:MAG: gas vesicle protein K [Rhodomicrobiaceae bacterium]